MTILKTVKSGESFSIGILLPDDYNLSHAQEIKIYFGGYECAHTIIDRMVKCELTSDYTATLFGNKEIEFWLDDINWGVRKYPLGYIRISSTSAPAHNESINTGYDIIINLSITETSIVITDVMYNYSKGDPFIYDNFTPEQLEALKGDILVGFFDIEDGNLVAYDTSDNAPFSLTLEEDNLVLTI